MDVFLNLPADEQAPRRARRQINRHLTHLEPAVRARLVLALSELVTNVVRHGGVGPQREVRVAVNNGAGPVRVSVEQPTAVRASVFAPDRARPGGHGLRIVEGVTDRWGFEPGPPGFVWFEVDP